MTIATIEGIKTIPSIPGKGEQYISVNLAMVRMAAIVRVAEDLGFNYDLVQIVYPIGGCEIHALLWAGRMNEAPNDLSDRIDALANRVPKAAIRSVRGAWTHKAA